MKHNSHSDSGEDAREQDADGQSMDELIAKAVNAAAKGENIDQLLELMLVSMPTKAKEKVRKRFAAALAKRGLRQPSTDVADIPARSTFSRMRKALNMTTKQMIDRIMQLVRSRPDIAAIIQQAGTTLTRNGVMANQVVPMSETELGTMAPTAVGKASPDRATGRATST